MKKYLLFITLLGTQLANAQKLTKEDEKTAKSLKSSVGYLADDKLEGRRTGTAGEKLAYEFIAKQFKKSGLAPVGDNGTYIQPFEVKEGKELKEGTFFKIGDKSLVLNEDYYPLPYSATGSGNFAKSGKKNIYLLEINALIDQNKDNPHFDLKESLLTEIKEKEKSGVDIIFLSNSEAKKEEIGYDDKDKTPQVGIPLIYLTAEGLKKYLAAERDLVNLSYNIVTGPKVREGHNVAGFVNNNAATTIVLGAHYDHLGYGEDHNSLYIGSTKMIHNGADDNASGTAALIELGKWTKTSAPKQFNYLLVAFSGEELGLYGSKYFADHSPVDLKNVNYMVNMDMVGRLNDSTRGLTIGGYGTSPLWGELIKTEDPYFKIKIDSAGSGPSDHTSFYKKDIPVLFFFTGTHSDYHKPSDDAEKINIPGEIAIINYIKNVITATAGKDKLAFSKTREASMGKNTFKVSLGIMPDYTFGGDGVLVDGVSENRPAQKAGIKTGDILIQLGDHPFNDVQSYMGALNKFNKGDTTTVKLKRGKEEISLQITF
ncbi:M28 family peptidase [Ferruginibacter sp. HRS2-29]|uniref:M28 family peptidase n=1 Tax=Ferruginibacter sp. HRS2-29 TaxID=2487334 RepID=UPI0020CCABBB|nr:M28 family peptidase [Ferruginibacter sp. HRS2-29]